MKRTPFHYSVFVLLIFTVLFPLTHCTIEKRLYTKGYHIENKRALHTDKTDQKTTDEVSEDIAVSEIASEKVSEVSFLDYGTSEMEEVQDSSMVTLPDKIEKDTVYIDDTYEVNIRRKQRNLLFTGIPALALGGISYRAISIATEAGAGLGQFALFGSFGAALGIVALIFLLAFIVILCIPANPGEARYAQKENPKLSRGDNTALVICLVTFGLIGLGFLVANVF